MEERFTLRYHILDSYFKVMFVRDPLQRLLSAYRDKFTGDPYGAVIFPRVVLKVTYSRLFFFEVTHLIFTGTNNLWEFATYRNSFAPKIVRDVRQWLDRPTISWLDSPSDPESDNTVC